MFKDNDIVVVLKTNKEYHIVKCNYDNMPVPSYTLNNGTQYWQFELAKQAGLMLIIKDGLILGISRRNDPTKFGLIGGGREIFDQSVKDTAIRETKEECSITVNDCILLYVQDDTNHICSCFFATDWSGEPTNSEEGNVEWLTEKEITETKSAFGQYNKNTLIEFRKTYPNIYIKKEQNAN